MSRRPTPTEQAFNNNREVAVKHLHDLGIGEAVLRAISSLNRQWFMPKAQVGEVYVNKPYWQESFPQESAVTSLYVVAKQFDLLFKEIGNLEGKEVVDIGAGTGYGSALFASLGAKVTMLEQSSYLARVARQALAKSGLAVRVLDVEVSDYLVDNPNTFEGMLVGASVTPRFIQEAGQALSRSGVMIAPLGGHCQNIYHARYERMCAMVAAGREGIPTQVHPGALYWFVPLQGPWGWKGFDRAEREELWELYYGDSGVS